MQTSIDLRKAFPGLNLITVSLTGGTLQYFPTAEMIDEGGYEGRATVVSRDAEKGLRAHVSAMIKEMGIR